MNNMDNKHSHQSDTTDTNDIKNRIADLKSRYADAPPERPRNQGMAVGFRVATDMVSGVLVGVFIGYQLDSFFNTKPIFLLIFIVIGMAAGIINVIRTANRLDNVKKNQ